MPTSSFRLAALVGLTVATLVVSAAEHSASLPIFHSAEATPLEILAAKEVRRYVYLRTGRLLPIRQANYAEPGMAGAIVVARKDRQLATTLLVDPALQSALSRIEPPEFWLRTVRYNRRPALLVTGGSEAATLYAAYRFAEHLDVRFYLHGDVLPDDRIPLQLPFLDERHIPLFRLRGIQPFHDFPEGPDWWNADDYAAVLAQLPKLRMNFFALHTYPENAPNAEPTVWIGRPEDAGPDGRVKFSYPSSYMNTLRGNWGYAARRTRDFLFGAAQLFEHDAFGPDVMLGYCPQPETPDDCNVVFQRAADQLRTAFDWARQLGIQTCVGTETPLTVPKQVQERLKAAGQDPTHPAVLESLYEGIFRRAAAAYPLDYYWFWTPEGWTWEGTKPEQIQRTLADLEAALRAHARIKPPFRLATCGWVLGPQHDRTLFDKVLPKEVAVSCINREVGRTPVDRSFAEISGRSKWAIPWLEDDPALTSPQLWVGRMRRDAADARRYGCDGLLGIHWRTRVLAPNVAALARAAWDQNPWNRTPFEPPPPPPRTAGPVGGAVADYPTNAIADTDLDPVFQTVRYNLSAYRLPVTNGTYRVILQFCEPHYGAAGKRVFNVSLQGRLVIKQLDIFERVGQNRALEVPIDNVPVTDGWIDLGFEPVVEFPSIAGIRVEGPTRLRLNCGGPAWQDYAADLPPVPSPAAPFAPTDDFYLDWAAHEFGPSAGTEAAKLFIRLDGQLPRPSDWVDGPGGLRPDTRPWEQVRPEYAFVDEFEALRPRVLGVGSQTRFEYWAATFRYLRATAQVNCAWGAYNQAVTRVGSASSPSVRHEYVRSVLIPLRVALVQKVGEVYDHLLATVSTPGELGTVANWEQHILPGLLHKPGEDLARWLGQEPPVLARPTIRYNGPTRLILPTVRTSLATGEALRLKVLVLSSQPRGEVWLRWRRLGSTAFAPVPAAPVDRGVYVVDLPADRTGEQDFEFYVEATDGTGLVARSPATAPVLNHTVVRVPPPTPRSL